MNQGLFPASRIQLMSGCAGAGREQSQAASPSWPVEIFHTTDVVLGLRMGVGQGAGICFSLFCEFKSSLGWEFELFWESGLFWECHKICIFLGSAIAHWGLAVNWSLGGEKNCMVYSLVYIFIIIIIISSSIFPLLPY